MNDVKTIIVVDDHKLVAAMWAELINSESDLSVIAICNNTDTALEKVEQMRPDVVLMDVNLQPMSGIDATKIIRKISPDTKVIGVSMHDQPSIAKEMIKSGASAYLTKSSEKQEMFDAIHAVLAGDVYICDEVIENISKY